MFWPSQCLLAANRLHQVPLSPRSGVLPTFRSSRCIPVDCIFTLTGPLAWIEAVHWLSIRLRRVKPAAFSGMYATPVSFRLSQRPLASIRHQVPLIHRSVPFPGLLRGQSGSAKFSPAFAGFHPVVFILADTRPLIEASRHCFRSLRPASPDRVLGMHATPIPPGGIVPPGRHHPAPGSYCCIHRLLDGPFA